MDEIPLVKSDDKPPGSKGGKNNSCLHFLRGWHLDSFIFGCKPVGQGRYNFGTLVLLGCAGRIHILVSDRKASR